MTHPQSIERPAESNETDRRPFAIFVDRDGVIVRHIQGYATRWRDIHVLPGALDALAQLSRAGYRLFVLTNQSAVGRGLMTQQTLDDIHSRLSHLVRGKGGAIEAFLVCPHAPSDHCACRKPGAGLFHIAERDHGVRLVGSYMIGDSEADMIAAHEVGCTAILVLSGVAMPEDANLADVVTRDLLSAADHILRTTKRLD